MCKWNAIWWVDGVLKMLLVGVILTIGAMAGISEEAAAGNPAALEQAVVAEVSNDVASQLQHRPGSGAALFRTQTPYVKANLKDAESIKLFDAVLKQVCEKHHGRLQNFSESDGAIGKQAEQLRSPGAPWPRLDPKRGYLFMDLSSEPQLGDTRGFLHHACWLPGDAIVMVAFGNYDNGFTNAEFLEDRNVRRVFLVAPAAFPLYATTLLNIAQRWEAYQARIAARVEQDESAQKEREAERAAQRKAIARQAAQRFEEAAALPKAIGVMVCSVNNRVGYVEQIALPRIKVSVRGRAIAFRGDYGLYGPAELDANFYAAPAQEGYPIADPYFLFLPLGQIRLNNATDLAWEMSLDWGECKYRF